jgi:hypothetical protein
VGSDIDRLISVRPIDEADVYFGPQTGWSRDREPRKPSRVGCRCGDVLGGLRYCPTCNRVRPADQVKLDNQPYQTHEPDPKVIAAMADEDGRTAEAVKPTGKARGTIEYSLDAPYRDYTRRSRKRKP